MQCDNCYNGFSLTRGKQERDLRLNETIKINGKWSSCEGVKKFDAGCSVGSKLEDLHVDYYKYTSGFAGVWNIVQKMHTQKSSVLG